MTDRLEKIAEACHRVIQLSDQIRMAPPEAREGLMLARHDILDDLNSRLSKYKWHPFVGNGAYPGEYFYIRYKFYSPDEPTFHENAAVQWIIRHIDLMHRVRRCDRELCRRWFFAITEHQKYCGANCRKQVASQEESFKKKRRAYMRKYRADQGKMDKKAKELVGRK